MGWSYTIVYTTLSIVNPSIGLPIVSTSALIKSVSILITNEHIWKTKTRYTYLRDYINVSSLLN